MDCPLAWQETVPVPRMEVVKVIYIKNGVGAECEANCCCDSTGEEKGEEGRKGSKEEGEREVSIEQEERKWCR